MYFVTNVTGGYDVDFFKICTKINKNSIEIFPDFTAVKSKNIMTRGKGFYAVWDKDKGLWSRDEYDLYRLVDEELYEFAKKYEGDNCNIKTFSSFNSNTLRQYKQFLSCVADNWTQLDDMVAFENTIVKREDYISHKVPYRFDKGSYDAYDEIMNTLYSADERKKLEWAIGSIFAGDSKKIQKFIVLYGAPGSGKSTFLNIVQQLFEGYFSTFDAKTLAGNTNAFATETFKSNPLLAIQHDGDLSRIEDNSKLNSIISHEPMTINEKYKASYTATINCFLFLGTNTPVKITDSKSGLLRRLIDVSPTGKKISEDRYNELMAQIPFELGAIAFHCYHVYKRMGKNYYSTYIPQDMMQRTNVFFNFMDESYSVFEREDQTTLKQAYEMYKGYCQDIGKQYWLDKAQVREELKSYFKEYERFHRIGGTTARDVYLGFIKSKIIGESFKPKEKHISTLQMDSEESYFDKIYKDCPAQYANEDGTPIFKWDNVRTTLKDLDTTKLHYVKVPEKHIVIDFDIKNEDGEKDEVLNCTEAKKFPATYSEFSKSGKGVHLHYIWEGDVSKLARNISDDIEIKIFTGGSSLRRRYTKSNDMEFTTISSGLPFKERKRMTTDTQIKSEQGLRRMIERNLNKEIHSATKPSCDFIFKILEDAYNSDMKYDLNDMRTKVLAFASNSSNNSEYCVNLVTKMHFQSKEINVSNDISDSEMVFYDVEVFPNLFVICYKVAGKDDIIKLINPSSLDIEQLLKYKLVGFNCRRYDNHILYGAYIGYNNEQLYNLSQKIIGKKGGFFGEAYNISYTDIYDFSAAKQSLKKWEIELGIRHHELGFKWDEAVPEENWELVASYCCNDVRATEAVFNHLKGDWAARQILAMLSNGSVNDTTNQLATKFIFGNEKHPQLVYTDLAETFPGYELKQEVDEAGKVRLRNMYRGTDVGFGGYVYAKYGYYENVVLMDVASMHPTSLINLNYFGEYTPKFKDILDARIMIKHGDIQNAKQIMNGALAEFLDNPEEIEALAYALKIVLNSQYGLTSSKFDVPQVDPRNINNIVALRGALFMRALQDELNERGYNVIHIKTDSIKIANGDQEVIDFCFEFAKQYGYTFEHEATYEKMCLITDADYICKYKWADKAKKIGTWSATGAQFAHPFIFKTLFSREPIEFNDLCETRNVTTALYLDMNEDLADGEHNYIFIGKTGQFCPIKSGRGGGILLAQREEKFNAAPSSKGYRWLESSLVKDQDKVDDIDMSYFVNKSDEMYKEIAKYTNPELFCSDNPIMEGGDISSDDGPVVMECGAISCEGCTELIQDGYHSDCAMGMDNTIFIEEKGE